MWKLRLCIKNNKIIHTSRDGLDLEAFSPIEWVIGCQQGVIEST